MRRVSIGFAMKGHTAGFRASSYIVIICGAVAMKTRVVRIGNSRGIRVPKVLLEQTGLPEEESSAPMATLL